VEPSAIIAMMGSAIATLFGALAALWAKRLKERDATIVRLERQLNELTALVILAADSAQGVEEMRKELARMLRESGRS